MGYSKDLGTGVVKSICEVTGYPKDEYGHLLDSTSSRDGTPIPNWDKPGTVLPNFTAPYGHLHYACGSGDDFTCFDYATINAGPRGEFIILHASLNSETGGFLENVGYEVLPCNSEAEQVIAVGEAIGIVDRAMDWCGENEVRHTRSGWNQEPFYFSRSVFCSLFNYLVREITERERRFGSKRLEKIIDEKLTEKRGKK